MCCAFELHLKKKKSEKEKKKKKRAEKAAVKVTEWKNFLGAQNKLNPEEKNKMWFPECEAQTPNDNDWQPNYIRAISKTARSHLPQCSQQAPIKHPSDAQINLLGKLKEAQTIIINLSLSQQPLVKGSE